MINIWGISLGFIDIAAFIWFWLIWVSYAVFADKKEDHNLVKVMHKYRLRWMEAMIKREDRLIDVRIVATLLRSTIFLASTSILIVGGLVAVLGYGDRALAIMTKMPFEVNMHLHMWIIKTMLLLSIFVYSFFKFTWVIRQFNYASVLIVAAPLCTGKEQSAEEIKHEASYVVKIATMLTNAGRHFNMGVRSYYFGLVALSWYISPIMFMVLSVLVVCVLYRREFMSKTLVLLT